MVSEFGDSQYTEFKPRISPFRWTRPKPPDGLSVRSRARFYMTCTDAFHVICVSSKPELRVVLDDGDRAGGGGREPHSQREVALAARLLGRRCSGRAGRLWRQREA